MVNTHSYSHFTDKNTEAQEEGASVACNHKLQGQDSKLGLAKCNAWVVKCPVQRRPLGGERRCKLH